VHTSLSTSIDTAAGTWVTVPMGRLDEPLNTFWELFFRRVGAAGWANQASALAVATNGGLVVSSDGASSLVVGIRPTNYLGFSPLIVTSNTRTWSPANPIGALADEPDSLALSQRGGALALVSSGKLAELVSSPRALGHWRRLATKSTLARSRAGRACGVVSLNAVGYLADTQLVGTACERAGSLGLFTPAGTSWRTVGSGLFDGLGTRSSAVLGFAATSGGLCVLIKVVLRRGSYLVGACATARASRWRVSAPWRLTGTSDTVSLGPAGGIGLFALVTARSGEARLVVLRASDMDWSELSSPPANTATAAFASGGVVDAIVVKGTLFTDWRLDRDGQGWKPIQQIRVPIEFGSSS
jgi:hypothetical protein